MEYTVPFFTRGYRWVFFECFAALNIDFKWSDEVQEGHAPEIGRHPQYNDANSDSCRIDPEERFQDFLIRHAVTIGDISRKVKLKLYFY